MAPTMRAKNTTNVLTTPWIDVRDLVREHRLDLLVAHRLQQPRRHGDQRRILERAGGERVGRAVVDRDLGHRHAGLGGQPADRFDEPCLMRVLRLLDHVRAGRPLGHLLRDQQRDDRAREPHDGRKRKQRPHLDSRLRYAGAVLASIEGARAPAS